MVKVPMLVDEDAVHLETEERGFVNGNHVRAQKSEGLSMGTMSALLLGEEDDEGLSYIFDVRVGLPQNT